MVESLSNINTEKGLAITLVLSSIEQSANQTVYTSQLLDNISTLESQVDLALKNFSASTWVSFSSTNNSAGLLDSAQVEYEQDFQQLKAMLDENYGPGAGSTVNLLISGKTELLRRLELFKSNITLLFVKSN